MHVEIWASCSQSCILPQTDPFPAALLVRSSRNQQGRPGQRVAAGGLMVHSAGAICCFTRLQSGVLATLVQGTTAEAFCCITPLEAANT